MLQLFVARNAEKLEPLMFQKDCASSRWILSVWEFVNHTYPGRWIGWNGPIACLHVHLALSIPFLSLGIRKGPSVSSDFCTGH
jgi:hypothetical protein